jgi:hypothetical protein
MLLVGMQIEHNKSRSAKRPILAYYEARYPWHDRRSGFDRRRFKNLILPFERRSGEDRRSIEIPAAIKYRKARTQLRRQLKEYQANHIPEHCLVGAIVLSVIIALISIIIFLRPI